MKYFPPCLKLESDERDTIQKLKDTERERVTEEMAAWQQKQVEVKGQEKSRSRAECLVVQQQNRGSGGEKVKWVKEGRLAGARVTEVWLHVKTTGAEKQKARRASQTCFLPDLLATSRSRSLPGLFQRHSGSHGSRRRRRWDTHSCPWPSCCTFRSCFHLEVTEWLCLLSSSGWWNKRKLSGRWMQMWQNWRTWRKPRGILSGWKTKESKWPPLCPGENVLFAHSLLCPFHQLILCSGRVSKRCERLQSGHQTQQKDPRSVLEPGCVSPEAKELSQGHWGFFSGQNCVPTGAFKVRNDCQY